MASSNIFETLLGAAHKAGEVARTAAKTAQDAWTAVEPGVTAALNKARSLTDPEARAQALAQLDDIIARAKTTGNAALGDLSSALTSLRDAAKGMPPQLVVRFTLLASVEERALVKGAAELPEVVACKKAAGAIREALGSDPAADVATQATELDALIIKASAAVDAFSSDENSVRNKLADATTMLGDLTKINAKAVAAQRMLVATIAGAPNENIDKTDAIAALTTTLATAQTAADEGKFAEAAVIVYPWTSTAHALLDERQKTLKAKNKQSAQPESVEGFFSTLYLSAERGKFVGEGGNAALNQQAAVVLTLARARPCDLQAAEDALQKFKEILAGLEAQSSNKA